jgi:mRNA interferase HigB
LGTIVVFKSFSLLRIISKKALIVFYNSHPDAEIALKVWYAEAKRARWKNFNELKQQFYSASIVGNGRVVFNIKGNDYRLVAKIDFEWQILFVRFIGTHREYDKIDASKV